MVNQLSVISCQCSGAPFFTELGTDICYSLRKCGKLSAGLPDSCCWSCSSQPSSRWGWPAPDNGKRCTACDRRRRRLQRSPRCNAIMRWHSHGRPSPIHHKPNRPKHLFKPSITAVRTIIAAALLPPSGRGPLSVCCPFLASSSNQRSRHKAQCFRQAISPDRIPRALHRAANLLAKL
jgi:hypothetical protein